jgi:anti-sigma B factor antagonist
MVGISVVNETSIIEIASKTLDRKTGQLLLQEVKAAAEGTKQVIVDLSNLHSLDSSGLGILLSCLRQVSAVAGALKLCCLSPRVRSLFLLTHMHGVFAVYNTRTEALRAFQVSAE